MTESKPERMCDVCSEPMEPRTGRGRPPLRHPECGRKKKGTRADGQPFRRAVGVVELADRSKLHPDQIARLIDVMKAALADGDRVQLTGFGSFRPHTLPARTFNRSELKNVFGDQAVIEKGPRQKVLFTISDRFRVALDPTFSPRFPDEDE